MQELVDVHFPKAERIRVVLDNLSTHSVGPLYQAFPPDEARRLLRRLEFHYRLNAGWCVLHHEAVFGRHPQLRGGEQENFRVRLALPQIASADIDAKGIEQSPTGTEMNLPHHSVGILR
jgi:hypothetical protein